MLESRKKNVLVIQEVNQELGCSRNIEKIWKIPSTSDMGTGNITAAHRIGLLGAVFSFGNAPTCRQASLSRAIASLAPRKLEQFASYFPS